MPEDRTTPMRQPQWSRQDLDDQETVFADQDSPTPPTMPLGDQDPRRAGASRQDRALCAPRPRAGRRPSPSRRPRPAAFSPQTPASDQTMVIAERPKPVFAWLVVVDGPDRGSIGQVHNLRPDTTTLGRAAGNHIALRDDTASAQHARIRVEARENEEPAFVLYDMGSSNGTFVGDKKTHKDEESRTYRHQLQDGDYMLIGETTLVFKKL